MASVRVDAVQQQAVVATASTLSAEVDQERRKDWTTAMREMETCFARVVAGLQHEPAGAVGGLVVKLPFVNRIAQLVEAATALLDNQSANAGGDAGGDIDQTANTLVMCAQMWGIGKTRFAVVLHECMQAWFDQKAEQSKTPRRVISRYRLNGIQDLPGETGRLTEAFVAMLQRACDRAGVVVDRLPVADYEEAVRKVSAALQTNDARQDGKRTTDLYIHFDEMDLHSDEAVKAFPKLKVMVGSDPVVKYRQVWRQFFQPLLMAPRIHLVVTGRVPQLALIGTGQMVQSPTRALHVVLGPLRAAHLVDSLRQAQLTNDALLRSVRLVDVLFGAADANTTDVALSGLCAELQRVTGGVPRVVACFLTMLVRRVDITGAPLPRDFRFSDEDVSDELHADVTLSTITAQATRKLARCTGSDAKRVRVMRELTQLALYAFGDAEATGPVEVAELIKLADRYGCYLAVGSTATARRVCIPLALHQILFGNGDVLADSLAGVLKPFVPQQMTPDENGQQLERLTMWALRLHLALSHAAGKPVRALLALAGASGAFDGVDWSQRAVFVKCESKFVRTNAATVARRWLHPGAEWLRGRTGVLLAPPKSRSGDAMCSLKLTSGKRRLVFFLCKSYVATKLGDLQLADEFAKCIEIMKAVSDGYESFVLVLVCTPTAYTGEHASGPIYWMPGMGTRGSVGGDTPPAFYFVNAPQAAIDGFLLGTGSAVTHAVAEAGEARASTPRDMHDLLARLDLLKHEAVLAAAYVTLAVLPLMTKTDLRKLGLPIGAVVALLDAVATHKSAK